MNICHSLKWNPFSDYRKLLCEFSKLSKLNAFILLGYYTNIDASILVYKFRPERTGFNMYATYTQLQLTLLALVPYIGLTSQEETPQYHFNSFKECQFVSQFQLLLGNPVNN